MIPTYVDTSAFYAYLVAGDRFHEPVRNVLHDLVSDNASLFSSSFALCETLGLLQIRHGRAAVQAFLDDVQPLIDWRWVDLKLYSQAEEILLATPGRGFTIVDACAVVCCRERPGSQCVAVDEDLTQFGFQVLPKGQ